MISTSAGSSRWECDGQYFAPGSELGEQDWPGSDQPAGKDSPWRPGFCAGFHVFLDMLGEYLAGKFDLEAQRKYVASVYAGESTYDWPPNADQSREEALIPVYREHIRRHCPTK